MLGRSGGCRPPPWTGCLPDRYSRALGIGDTTSAEGRMEQLVECMAQRSPMIGPILRLSVLWGPLVPRPRTSSARAAPRKHPTRLDRPAPLTLIASQSFGNRATESRSFGSAEGSANRELFVKMVCPVRTPPQQSARIRRRKHPQPPAAIAGAAHPCPINATPHLGRLLSFSSQSKVGGRESMANAK